MVLFSYICSSLCINKLYLVGKIYSTYTFVHLIKLMARGFSGDSGVRQVYAPQLLGLYDEEEFSDDEDDVEDVNDEGDDVNDDGEDVDGASSDGSSFGEDVPGYVEYTTEQLSQLCNMNKRKPRTVVKLSTEESSPPSKVIKIEKNEISSLDKPTNHVTLPSIRNSSSKFKCGYCSFSAALRVKVKMHCVKKHGDRRQFIIDPPSRATSLVPAPQSDSHTPENNIVDVDCDEFKGTKFEQDMRKAGVAKLNLASLFPNSKRFKRGSANNQSNTSHEFKKPKSPSPMLPCEEGQTDDIIANNLEKSEKPIQDISSPQSPRAKNSVIGDDSIGETDRQQGGKLHTAYPHCTAVILADEDSGSSCDAPMDAENQIGSPNGEDESGVEAQRSPAAEDDGGSGDESKENQAVNPQESVPSSQDMDTIISLKKQQHVHDIEPFCNGVAEFVNGSESGEWNCLICYIVTHAACHSVPFFLFPLFSLSVLYSIC